MAKRTDFDREMNRLEAEIKRLEVEYNQFFAGRLPRLPWETRARVEQMVKQYDRMNLSNTAQRFRFGTVQARFMSFCELWERNLRAKEDGRGVRARTAASAPIASATTGNSVAAGDDTGDEAVSEQPSRSETIEPAIPPPPQSPGPTEPVRPVAFTPPAPAPPTVVRPVIETTRIGDLGRDSDRVSALYDELTRARQATGEPPMPFDRFSTVVKAQVAKLGGGGTDVAFKVSVSHGKVTLMAKKVDE